MSAFQNGYHFWENSYGFLTVRKSKNQEKWHCQLNNCPHDWPSTLHLYGSGPDQIFHRLATVNLVVQPGKSPRTLQKGEVSFVLEGSNTIDAIHLISPKDHSTLLEIYASRRSTPRQDTEKEPPLVPSQPTQDLSQILSSLLEPVDPFQTTNAAYHWWRCVDKQQLRQVLQKCRIRLAPFFREGIEETFSRYQHLVIGRYLQQKPERSFLILAFPSQKETRHVCNEQNVARWVACYEGKEIQGYWLYYFDYQQASLVRAVLRE